ncbi:MAG: hypothetical protein M0006_02930 [Magnetospirillum sp.]|nr:hypothetical protein [Magnetospirillum sp.]
MSLCLGRYRATLPPGWTVARVADGHKCPAIEAWIGQGNLSARWCWRTTFGVIEFAFADGADAGRFAAVWG